MGLGVGENYVWCLVMLVIFMGFGGAKKWRWSSYTSFYGEGGGRGLSLCNINILKLYFKSYWVLQKALYGTPFHYVTSVLPVLYDMKN